MKSDQAQFGECLREALRYAGVGEGGKELADLVVAHGGEAVSSQAAHDWIHGKKFPKPRNIKALAVLISPEPQPRVAGFASLAAQHEAN